MARLANAALEPRASIASRPGADESIGEKLAWALNFAVLAPSKYNTQPWYFEITDGAVDVHADGARALTEADPYGREMLIGCGAALANLRLGIRALGYEPAVHLFPQRASFSHLARVRLGAATPITADEQRLVDAVPRRHTQWMPLNGKDVPASLIESLVEAANREGAQLRFLTADVTAHVVDDVVDRRDRWEHPGDDSSLVALLWTAGDEPAEWLLAGQAVQMVLLRACVSDVHASFLNEPIESSDLRQQLAQMLGISGFPQMMLRLGWGVGAACTPRRSAESVTFRDGGRV